MIIILQLINSERLRDPKGSQTRHDVRVTTPAAVMID
jgi:hypothetical protein